MHCVHTYKHTLYCLQTTNVAILCCTEIIAISKYIKEKYEELICFALGLHNFFTV